MGNENTREREIKYSNFLCQHLTGRFPRTIEMERMHSKVLKKLAHNVYFDRDPFKDTPKWLTIDHPLRQENFNFNKSAYKDSPSQMSFKANLFSKDLRPNSDRTKAFLSFPGAPKKTLAESNDKFFLSQRKITELTLPTHRSDFTGNSQASHRLTDRIFLQNESSRTGGKMDLILPQEEDVGSENETPRMGFEEQPNKTFIQTKILLDCSLEEQLFTKMPSNVLYNILEFLIHDYQSLVLVSSLWHFKIKEVFEKELRAIDLSFSNCYKGILPLKDAYSTTVYDGGSAARPGFRIDRNLIAETTGALTGKAVMIGYSYKLKNNLDKEVSVHFKFDVLSEGSHRKIWVYKEDLASEDQKEIFSITEPIVPVCEGDRIKLAISVINAVSFVKIKSIQWHKPIFSSIPTIPKNIDVNHLGGIDRNRICELEEFQTEWCHYLYFHRHVQRFIHDLGPCFQHISSECSGVGFLAIKSFYKAIKGGVLTDSFDKISVNIEVIDKGQPALAEVKRTGVFQDIERFLQLRVGDTLIFYQTIGEYTENFPISKFTAPKSCCM